MKEFKTDKNMYSTYKTMNHDIIRLMEQCTTYLVKKLPLSNVLLKNLACLSPLFRQQPTSFQKTGVVVVCLPYLSTDKMKNDVLHEWQKYQTDDIPEEFYVCEQGQNSDGTSYVKFRRVNEYWFFSSSSAGIQQWEDPVNAGASWRETTIDSMVVQRNPPKCMLE